MATINQSSQNIQPPENTPNPNMKNEKEEDINGDIDQEDILSLCDLPVHSIMSDTTGHDHQDSNSNEFPQNSSFSVDKDKDNFFEFFSEEWNMTTTTVATVDTTAATTTSVISKSSPFPPYDENIIFCEKKIPTEQTLSNANEPTTLNHKTKKVPTESQEKRGSLIPWKSNSIFSKSKRDSKLLLVLFGLPPKIPTDETELMSDIRIRQSRRAPSTFLPSDGGDCGGDQEVAAVTRRRASENVLWRLIKAASCFGGQQRENGVV